MNKLNSLIIAILSTSLVLPLAYTATSQQVSNQANYVLANNTLSSEQIRQLAQSITVKVLSNNKGGSGVLISKQGKTYTILTNAHVISTKGTHSIQTVDGKTHTATVINRGDSLAGNDLAVLQFKSEDNYQVIPLANNSNLSENQEVFAAGFPDDSKKLVISNGKISLLSTQPLVGGYQIGYTNEVRQGMSGGALLNQSGELIGINGLTNNAILTDAYAYQDGTKPSAEQIQQLRKLSFAVPIQTLAKVAPNLAIIPPQWRNQQQAKKPPEGNTLADKVNKVAEQITVRIDSKNNGNGSGVIIAKQGDTYYVVTARHVVKEPDTYEIITPDGKRYAVQPENIFKPDSLDAAIVKFTSNQNYSVATIAKYNIYSSVKNRWIFLSGFPGESGGKRKLTAGLLSRSGTVLVRADSLGYLNYVIDVGYGLTYTNLTQPGMSGGAVLDSMGQVIGINTGSEDKKSGEVELGLGLGVPSNSILGLAKKSGLKPELLKVVTTSPPKLTEAEINLLQNHPLFAAQKPPQNAIEYDWLNYANQLWRLKKFSESVAAFEQAIKLKPDFYEAYLGLGVTLYSQDKYPEALAAYEQAIKIQPDNDKAWVNKSGVLSDLKKYSEALAAIDKAIEYSSNSDVNLYAIRASRLDDLKRYPEALAAISKAIEMKPLYFYYRSRSYIRIESKDVQGALADANQAIQFQPDDAGNYGTRSLIRTTADDFQGALADANQAIQLQPDNALNYYQRSNIHYFLKDYQAALADGNQAIQLEPDNALYYSERSGIRRLSKDAQGALADINQAIQLQPDSANYYIDRGRLRFYLKDYQGMLPDCNQAIKLEPNNGEGYSCRGLARYIQDPQGALSDYNQAILLDPDNLHYNYYTERGEIRRFSKDYQGALADYDRAIQLLPGSNSLLLLNSSFRNQGLAIAYLGKGLVRHNLKDYQGALADYNEAIKLDPNSALAYKGRSDDHYLLKDYQAGLTDINQAIKIEPNNGEYYLNRGAFYIQLKDYQAALADLKQAIKLRPDIAQEYFQRGFVYIQLKDYQAALADYSQVIKLQPDNADAYLSRGDVYVQLKDYQAALADYSQGIKLQSDNAQAYVARGVVRFQLKDYQGALADYSQAIKLQPDNANAYFGRGVIYHKQGNDNAALSDYNQAIAKDGKLAPAIINIGYIKYENGDVDGAIQQWEKAVQINSSLAEPQMALAVALYAKGEQQKALSMAQAALRLDKSWADVEVLKQNLWGTRLIDEARKLLATPTIQAFIK